MTAKTRNEVIRTVYEASGRSVNETVRLTGLSRSTVTNVIAGGRGPGRQPLSFSPEEIQEVLDIYDRTLSVTETAREFGRSYNIVRRVLKENNALSSHKKADRIVESFRKHGLIEKSMSDANATRYYVRSVLKKHGMCPKPSEHSYTVDETFFDEILFESQSYILGFIAADGHVGDRSISISLAKQDRDILVRIRNAMRSNHKINTRTASEGNRQDQAILTIGSVKLSNMLLHMGFNSLKSYDYDPKITLKHIDTELRNHFWRGIIDGDGSLDGNKISLTGTYETCESFIDFVQKCDPSANNPVPRSRAGQSGCSVSVYSLETMRSLYENSTIFLARKKAAAMKAVRPKKLRRARISPFDEIPTEELMERFKELGSWNQVASLYGMSKGTMANQRRKRSIEVTGHRTKLTVFNDVTDAEIKRRRREMGNWTCVADSFGVCQQAMYHEIHRRKIPLKPNKW